MERINLNPFYLMRRLYDWTLSWAKSPYSLVALGALSVAESSFFPIPPDVLLIALCAGAHQKWLKFAVVTSVCSVVGGMIGYAIGYFAYDSLGYPIMSFVAGISGDDPDRLIELARYWFNEKEVMGVLIGPWAVGAAGLTPIPYKVFTISAGFFHMDFGAKSNKQNIRRNGEKRAFRYA